MLANTWQKQSWRTQFELANLIWVGEQKRSLGEIAIGFGEKNFDLANRDLYVANKGMNLANIRIDLVKSSNFNKCFARNHTKSASLIALKFEKLADLRFEISYTKFCVINYTMRSRRFLPLGVILTFFSKILKQ